MVVLEIEVAFMKNFLSDTIFLKFATLRGNHKNYRDSIVPSL